MVLIRVNTNCEETISLCCINHAKTCTTGCVVNNVGSPFVLTDSQLSTFTWVSKVASIVYEHLGFRISVFYPFFKSDLELVNKRYFHTTYESNLIGLSH